MPAKDDMQAVAGPGRLMVCIQTAGAFLDEQLEALVESARQPALVAARDAGDSEEEARFLALLEEVEALCPLATAAFHDAVLAKLRKPEQGAATQVQDDAGLELVETAKVDDWVRLRRLLVRHTEQAQALERHVWARFAAAAGLPAHPDDCPLSLQGVCVSFQAAMQNLGAGRDARTAIYDAFEATVVDKLGLLFVDLDAILNDVSLDALDALPVADPQPGREVRSESLVDELAQADGAMAPDSARLLSVLASVQRGVAATSDTTALDAECLATQLVQAIAPPGVALDEDERHTVSVVATVVQQIVEHPDIDPGVKARLRRLAPPFLLLALQSNDYLEAEFGAARHDPVTGLLDRLALRARLESALLRCADTGAGLAVCLVDVDGFSAITERLGHQVGGRLLRALADLLRTTAGAGAAIARLRGDEFVVLLPTDSADAGHLFSERYLAALANARFALDGEQVRLAVSIGIVESAQTLATSGAVMQAADEARRAAKAAGGACLFSYGAGEQG